MVGTFILSQEVLELKSMLNNKTCRTSKTTHMVIHITTLGAKLTQKDKPKNALDKTHWECFAFLEEMVNHVIC